MKILAFAHQLEVGGTQVNAIDLAAALRDVHGHDVTVFAAHGPMVDLIRRKGLRYIEAPEARVYPSPRRMRALREIVLRERPDVVHAWDWWQAVDAFYGVHLPMRTPVVVSDMCMTLTRMLPKTLPTTFGVPALVEEARAKGWRSVETLLPPVDTELNAPGAVDAHTFRQQHGINAGELLFVTVSRLSESLKGDSLRRSVEAVRTLGRELPLRLLIVGDGALRAELERQADRVNSELGRTAVSLPGALLDPRPAYAAADVFIGMGSSALRAMAFAKPVIVVGEDGFAAPFDRSTVAWFYQRGMYGVGSHGPHIGLTASMRHFARHDALASIGSLSRRFVSRHFALDVVGAALSRACDAAVRQPVDTRRAALDGVRTMAVWLRERRFVPGQRAFVQRAGGPVSAVAGRPA